MDTIIDCEWVDKSLPVKCLKKDPKKFFSKVQSNCVKKKERKKKFVKTHFEMSVKLLRNYEISDTLFLPLVTDSLHRTISVQYT